MQSNQQSGSTENFHELEVKKNHKNLNMASDNVKAKAARTLMDDTDSEEENDGMMVFDDNFLKNMNKVLPQPGLNKDVDIFHANRDVSGEIEGLAGGDESDAQDDDDDFLSADGEIDEISIPNPLHKHKYVPPPAKISELNEDDEHNENVAPTAHAPTEAIVEPPEWKRFNLKADSRLLVVAAKTASSSTPFLRELINRSLAQYKSILLIDLNSTRDASYKVVAQPLPPVETVTGWQPDFSLPMAEDGLRSYMRAVLTLLTRCKKHGSLAQMPWVINGRGYDSKDDYIVLRSLIEHLNTTEIVHLGELSPRRFGWFHDEINSAEPSSALLGN